VAASDPSARPLILAAAADPDARLLIPAPAAGRPGVSGAPARVAVCGG